MRSVLHDESVTGGGSTEPDFTFSWESGLSGSDNTGRAFGATEEALTIINGQPKMY